MTTSPAQAPGQGWFVTTHWSVVLNAGRTDTTHARAALAKLCQTYWYPLYAYVRWRGHSPEDAEDLTQSFLARLLEKNSLAGITKERGKFRSYLLTALNHFLVDEWKRARTLKRGGARLISLDTATAETRFRHEPIETATAESIFERNWALALLDQVYEKLRHEYEVSGKGKLFEELKFCLTGERSALPYAQLSAKLGISEGALKVTVHRLRQRYRELLRMEVADTLSDSEEIEEELRYLFRVLCR